MKRFLRPLVLALMTGCAAPSASPPGEARSGQEGFLGLETRAPSAAEAREFGLKKVAIPFQGQVVESVEARGPADRAGIAPGDVILQLNANRIYSIDALRDFQRVTPPGREVSVLLKRAGTRKEEEVRVALGGRPADPTGIAWEFASLEQLDDAVAKAKRANGNVLVGLSGADT